MGNKYGGFPYREDSQNYLDVKEYLNSEGYEWNIAKLTTGPEDVNQDGVVDAKDLGHILGAYGSKAEKCYKHMILMMMARLILLI